MEIHPIIQAIPMDPSLQVIFHVEIGDPDALLMAPESGLFQQMSQGVTHASMTLGNVVRDQQSSAVGPFGLRPHAQLKMSLASPIRQRHLQFFPASAFVNELAPTKVVIPVPDRSRFLDVE